MKKNRLESFVSMFRASTRRRESTPQSRAARFEPLETRDMLSVSAAEYAAIREEYAEFGLPASSSEINIVEIDAANLTIASLKEALEEAGSTKTDDLIVVRTTDAANTLTFSKSSDSIAVELDANVFGKTSIVALGTQPLTIDAAGKGRALALAVGSLDLGGVTLKGGAGADYGAALLNKDTLVMKNCSVVGGSFAASGLGANLYSTGTTIAIDCKFSGASGGASVYSTGTLNFNGCAIVDNQAEGLRLEGEGAAALFDCAISNNALGVANAQYAELVMTSCEISSNEGVGLLNYGSATMSQCVVAQNQGAGVRNVSTYVGANANPISAYLKATRSKFVANADGGVYSFGGTLLLSNCELSQNVAEVGGGVYCEYAADQTNKATIANCTIAGNYASTSGGGAVVDASFACALNNSIVAMNLSGDVDSNLSGSVVSRNNLVGGNASFVVAPIFDPATHKLANGGEIDLRLAASSAAINIGDKAYVADGDLDLAGADRVYGKSVDAGAYEYRGSGEKAVTPSYVVTTLDDSFDLTDGKTSLREALYFAADSSKTITFSSDLSGSVKLNSQLVVTSPIAIDGDGRVTLDAQNAGRALLVEAALTITGLTIANGSTTGDGGLVYADAKLAIENATLASGACGEGRDGGLVYASGAFSATNVVFSGSKSDYALYLTGEAAITSSAVADSEGSGIYSADSLTLASSEVYGSALNGVVNDYGAVTIASSTLRDSGASGLYNVGTAELTNCVVENNKNVGIYNQSVEIGSYVYASTVSAKNTIVRNNAGVSGSGVYNRFGRVEAVNCVFSGNSASSSGGAIYTESRSGSPNAVSLKNCTLAGNTAGVNGGAIASSGSDALLILYNTIVAQNLAGDVDSNISGEISLSSGSFVGSNPGFVVAPQFNFATKTLVNADALDLRLTENSAALDKGDAVVLDDDNTADLAGNKRVYGKYVDPGAYEYQGSGETSYEPVYVVDTLTDSFNLTDGKTSLREALYFANASNASITFSSKLSGTILLKSQLVSTSGVTIDGEGKIAISGQNKYRVLLNEGTAVLRDVVLTSGKSSSYGDVVYSSGSISFDSALVSGGQNAAVDDSASVYALGTLTAVDSTFSESKSASALRVLGNADLTNCFVQNNEHYGVYVSGTFKAADSTIQRNGAAGVYNRYGTVELKRVDLASNASSGLVNLGSSTLTRCVVSDNAESGLVNLTETYSNSSVFSGTLKIYLSTIKGNSASDSGAGVSNQGGFVEIDNSEISANRASRYGGGVYNEFVTNGLNKTNIVNCTIAGNYAGLQGGGLYIASESFTTSTLNTIVARNYSTQTNANVEGYVAVSDACLTSGNPRFVAGPTFSDEGELLNADSLDLRLTSASVAIDLGVNSYVVGTLDLDGVGRVFNNVVDLGAYEYYVEGSTYVTTLDDSFDLNDDVVSLREALYFAQDGDLVAFDPSLQGTITLDSTLELTSDVTILGSKGISLSGNGAVQILKTSGTVTISNLTFTLGYTETLGGAIYNSGALTLENCYFKENKAANGGAVYNKPGATLTLDGCTFWSNDSTTTGGAVYNSGVLLATSVSFTQNASGFNGGAVYNTGSAQFTNSAIVDSKAQTNGGGVYSSGSALTLVDCTVAGNSAESGGGIYLNSGTCALYNDVVALNSSDFSGSSAKTTARYVLSSYAFANAEENYLYDETLPLFADAANGNYRLADDSQAIDLGSSEIARENDLGTYSLDLAKSARYVGNAIDLGAYENAFAVDIRVQENCSFELKVDAASTDKVYWDLSGTGEGEYVLTSSDEWISAKDRGFTPGVYYLRSKVVSQSGSVQEQTLTLQVAAVLPVLAIESLVTPIDDVAAFSVDARFLGETPDRTWRVDWGDGQSTAYDSDSFTASHFYAESDVDASYTIDLVLVGDDGLDEYAFQLGVHSIQGVVQTSDAALEQDALDSIWEDWADEEAVEF